MLSMVNPYTELISMSINKVYQNGIAQKILQYMDKVHNYSDIKQARRWVMELLQNAGDVAYPDEKVKVRITLTKDELIFEHTGKLFRVKDILSLVNQVSGKNPGESIGMFGTGFMSTYQLSDVVEVESYLEDSGYAPMKFHITLDRTSNDKEGILKSIQDNIYTLCNEIKVETPVKGGFNTKFIYKLNTINSYDTAKTGVDDLVNSAKYILVFSKNLQSIEIKGDIEASYTLGDMSTVDDVNVYEVNNTQVYTLTEGDETIACSYVDGMFDREENVPRLFIDFPLVGSEEFPFPIIIDSRRFIPNEGRDNIPLLDSSRSAASINNKEVIRHAVQMYCKLINKLYDSYSYEMITLMFVPKLEYNKEHSEYWIESDIYRVIYNNCISSRIKGKVLDATEYGEFDELADIVSKCTECASDADWYPIIKNYEVKIDKVSYTDIAENVDRYYISVDDEDKLVWLQMLYNQLLKIPELADRIKAGYVKIFPAQDGSLSYVNYIYIDTNIPEILKNFMSKCGLNVRSELLRIDFDHGDILIKDYNISTVESYVRGQVNLSDEALNILLACGPDKDIYNSYKKYHGINTPYNGLADLRFDKDMWRNAYLKAVNYLIHYLEHNNALDDIDSLNAAYEVIYSYDKMAFNSHAIVYNHNNTHQKIDSSLWQADCDSNLFSILMQLNPYNGLPAHLLHKDVVLPDGVYIAKFLTSDLAGKITNIIQTHLNQNDLSKEQDYFQEACSALMSWLEDNDKDGVIFPAFASVESRMRLLTPKAAAIIHSKNKEADALFEEYGCNNVEEFREFLKTHALIANKGDAGDKGGDWTPLVDFFGTDSRTEITEAIGELGESWVISYLVESHILDGWEISFATKYTKYGYDLYQHCKLVKGRQEVVITNQNIGNSQAGYDISVSYNDVITKLIEVKTQSPTSVKLGTVHLSASQLAEWFKNGSDYSVYHVYLDYKNYTAKELHIYNDINRCFGCGDIVPTSEIILNMKSKAEEDISFM